MDGTLVIRVMRMRVMMGRMMSLRKTVWSGFGVEAGARQPLRGWHLSPRERRSPFAEKGGAGAARRGVPAFEGWRYAPCSARDAGRTSSLGGKLFGGCLKGQQAYCPEGAGVVVSPGPTTRPRAVRVRPPSPAGLPSTPSELTVMSRTPSGADEHRHRTLF